VTAADPAILSLRSVTKRYPGVIANDNLSIDFLRGEVHVLLGENGAGKSTLVAMLSGLQTPDEGTLVRAGTPQRISSPARALALGIGTVFQHSMLVPSLTVAENIALGDRWYKRPNLAAIAARMQETCVLIGVTLNPHAIVGTLSLGEQQQVEIVRALMRGTELLILDEATAMLTPQGTDALGALMRRLAERDLAVLFITHKLNEALAFGDRISVLRLGRLAGQIGPGQIAKGQGHDAAQTAAEIIRLMFGTAPQTAASPPPAPVPHAARALQIVALAVAGDSPTIDLTVAAGEILGVAGIDGNGQKQFAEALAGQRAIHAGRIFLDGTAIETLSVGDRHKRGLRYVTDDRLGEGTITDFPIALNLLLKDVGASPFWRRGVERPACIDAHANALVEAFDVRTPGIHTPIGKLSGGNIQKAVLARELSGPARAVIFAKPTYGLDVQNIHATRARIRAAAASGLAVILISTDLDEILELSHRIAVMSAGRLVGIVENTHAARQSVGEMMSGIAA
jgi:simple sugar transport system ATP-binding protein